MAELLERARPSAESEVEKITVRLSGDALSLVRRLAGREGISINEFIRRAVNTEAYFLEEIQNGSKIMVEDSSSKMKQIVFR